MSFAECAGSDGECPNASVPRSAANGSTRCTSVRTRALSLSDRCCARWLVGGPCQGRVGRGRQRGSGRFRPPPIRRGDGRASPALDRRAASAAPAGSVASISVPPPGADSSRIVAALGLDPVAHAEQAVRGERGGCGVEADAVVAHRDRDARRRAAPSVTCDLGSPSRTWRCWSAPPGPGGRPSAAAAGLRSTGCELAVDLDLAARAELAQQDLERRDQAEVAERRRPQVLDDPALQRDAAVERLVQVGQPLGDLGRGVAPRRDLRRATSSLAAVSRAPSSSCSSRARRLRSSSRTVCRCCASSFSCAVRAATSTLEAVALGLRRRAAARRAGAIERRGLAQVHEQREQAQRRHRRDADAVQQQRLVDALAAPSRPARVSSASSCSLRLRTCSIFSLPMSVSISSRQPFSAALVVQRRSSSPARSASRRSRLRDLGHQSAPASGPCA